jgi:hypothetical protein
MKKLIPAVALVLATGLATAEEKLAPRTGESVRTVEVVSADVPAKSLTIKSGQGQSTLIVEEVAIPSLAGVEPGDSVTISVRDGAAGGRRVVSAIVKGSVRAAAEKATPEASLLLTKTSRGTALLTLDPHTKTVTKLGPAGTKQTLPVDDTATVSITDVRPGEKVLVSYRFDKDGQPEAIVRVARPGEGNPD